MFSLQGLLVSISCYFANDDKKFCEFILHTLLFGGCLAFCFISPYAWILSLALNILILEHSKTNFISYKNEDPDFRTSIYCLFLLSISYFCQSFGNQFCQGCLIYNLGNPVFSRAFFIPLKGLYWQTTLFHSLFEKRNIIQLFFLSTTL